MTVTPPEFVPREDRRRHTEARLARNVAVLFGIPADRAPSRSTWICDYNELTIKEIGRGAPSEIEHPDLDVIPTATLHRYGPETKSALVLAAADRLFATVETTMQDVLDILTTCDDGRPYPDAMRATAWASLTSYAFQAQPALFVAAVHARDVQRAATAEWRPLVGRDFDALRSEYRPDRNELSTPRPRTLGIVDRLMHDVVAPRSPVTLAAIEAEGGGPSDHFLTDSLIDRWIRHLVYSADSGISIARRDEHGHWLDSYVPHLAALSSFAADAMGHYNLVEPFRATGAHVDPVLEPFDKRDPAHVARMIPRVPSLPELIKIPRSSQEALIGVTFHLIRVLRDGNTFHSPGMNRDCVAALAATTELAESVLGADSFVTMQAALGLARMRSIDLRDGDRAESAPAADAVIDRYQAMRSRHQLGALSMGDWIECVNATSPRLNAIAQDLIGGGDDASAADLRAMVSADWESVLSALRLDPARNQGFEVGDLPVAIASIAHNYFGFEIKSPDLTRRVHALRMARDIVLPQRRVVAAQRRNDNAIRLSLQVALRGACSIIAQLDGQHRHDLLSDIASWTGQLRETSLATSLLGGEIREGDYLPGHVNLLTALLSGELALAEHTHEPPPPPEHFVLLARAEIGASGVPSFAELSNASDRVRQVTDLLDRYRDLTGTEVPR